MKNWQEIIKYHRFRYINHTHQDTLEDIPVTALSSFAIDDALATSVSHKTSPPTIRAWAHTDTVVLGIADAQVPYLKEGVNFLTEEGYHVVIRNSGGLAVLLDKGVLNLSLVLPDVRHLSIHDCYEAMVSFIKFVLSDLTDDIQAFEIIGSYCPGDYDLSIQNRKFAGISQRRIKDGVAIQIYLDVEGSSEKRAALIREFYHRGIQGEQTRFSYPTIQPEKMASLSNLLGIPLTIDDMRQRVVATLNELNNEVIESTEFSRSELEVFHHRYEQMIKRNQPIAELL